MAGGMRGARLVLAAIGIAGSTTMARPAIHHVPSEYPTIQAGIDASASGDTVYVQALIYTGPGNVGISFRGLAVSVIGLGGIRPVIDGEGIYGNAFRFTSGEGGQSILRHFRITRFNDGTASPIECRGSSPTLRDLIIEDCGTAYLGDIFEAGGAIRCEVGAAPLLEYSVLRNCAKAYGGGAYVDESSALTARFTSFENCRSKHGGAILAPFWPIGGASQIELESCGFVECAALGGYDNHGNHFGGNGGAVQCRGTLTIRDCRFSDCWASHAGNAGGHGGAVYVEDGELLIESSEFANCSAWSGGAIWTEAPATITQVTIDAGANTLGAIGIDGVYSQIAQTLITNCAGYGIWLEAGTASVSCSDLFGNTGSNYGGMLTDQTGFNGNISADPIYCTAVFNPASPLSLDEDSPCAAANNSCELTIGRNEVGCTVAWFRVSGRVTDYFGAPLAGTTIAGAYESTASDEAGDFAFSAPLGWSGTLTPHLGVLGFQPSSRSIEAIAAHVEGQDFMGFAYFEVSGSIATPEGTPLSGVQILGGPTVATTSASGAYTVTLPQGWSGSLAPQRAGLAFTPPSRSYADVQADFPGQDYVGDGQGLLRVPSEFLTIAAALAVCAPRDTILVAPGEYMGPGFRNLAWGDLDLTLISEAGASETIIDLDRESRFARILNAGVGERLEGFTLRNGWVNSADPGGGRGGALCLENSAPVLNDLIIENCTAQTAEGGGIYALAADFTLEDARLENNESLAGMGGGLYCQGPSVSELRRVVFLSNEAVLHGGGLAISGQSTPLLRQVTFHANTSQAAGGAIFATGASPADVSGILATLNIATAGGGLYVVDAGSLPTLSCSNLFGNTPGNYGGALSDQTGLNGNLSAWPYYCDLALPDLHLLAESPCLPVNNSCGVLMGALEGCEITAVPAPAPGTLALSAHPNPFNPGTTLRLVLPAPAQAELRVFDLAGRCVASPLAAALPAGERRLVWQARDDAGRALPSGVYLLELRAGGQTRRLKLLLLK